MVFAHITVTYNIFPDHNGIINQQTNTERKCQQRHHIDGETKGPDKG